MEVEEVFNKMLGGEELHSVETSNDIIYRIHGSPYASIKEHDTILWGEEHTVYLVECAGYLYIIEDTKDGHAIVNGKIAYEDWEQMLREDIIRKLENKIEENGEAELYAHNTPAEGGNGAVFVRLYYGRNGKLRARIEYGIWRNPGYDWFDTKPEYYDAEIREVNWDEYEKPDKVIIAPNGVFLPDGASFSHIEYE